MGNQMVQEQYPNQNVVISHKKITLFNCLVYQRETKISADNPNYVIIPRQKFNGFWQGINRHEMILQERNQDLGAYQINKQHVIVQYEQVMIHRKRLVETISKYQKQIQKADQFGKKAKDPAKFKQFQARALQNYISELKKMNLPQIAAKQNENCIKFIVGRISSGKSSLINHLFNKDLPVGLGETTKQTELVYSQNGVLIYDTPGQGQAFNITKLDIIEEITPCHQIYILYNDSLKVIEKMVKVIAAIKPNHTILLRTQCDRLSQNSNRTIQEEIQQDNKILDKWQIALPIYTTSAFSDGFDNKIVIQLMKRNVSTNLR